MNCRLARSPFNCGAVRPSSQQFGKQQRIQSLLDRMDPKELAAMPPVALKQYLIMAGRASGDDEGGRLDGSGGADGRQSHRNRPGQLQPGHNKQQQQQQQQQQQPGSRPSTAPTRPSVAPEPFQTTYVSQSVHPSPPSKQNPIFVSLVFMDGMVLKPTLTALN